MDFKELFEALRKWWRLIAVAALLAGVTSFVAASMQPPVYRTAATLMVGRAIDNPNPTGDEFYLSQQLAGSYADLAQRSPVREAAMAALQLGALPEYIARALPNSQLVEISVTDTDPVRAQAVANELANQLIRKSPTDVEGGTADRQQFVNRQLDQLEASIEATEGEIEAQNLRLAGLASAREIDDTQTTIAALEEKLSTLQINYASLLASTQSGAANSISVIEPAALPTVPVGPNKAIIVLLAVAVALVLAVSTAFLLERMDETLRTPSEVVRALKIPVLGFIAEMRHADLRSETVSPGEGVALKPEDAEAFRFLRMNLEFVWRKMGARTLLVTSPGPGDGKTTVAVRLAAVLAQEGARVILVDGDLRRPSVGKTLGLDNNAGMCDLLKGQREVADVLHAIDGSSLGVITSGARLERPSEWMTLARLTGIVRCLREESDITIIDSPPFGVTESLVLSSIVDGVLLVVRPGTTTQSAAVAIKEQLGRARANILGVVINRVPRSVAFTRGDYSLPASYMGYGSDIPAPSPSSTEKGTTRRKPRSSGSAKGEAPGTEVPPT
jgi:succinoglycan biosynthesis transport protein ExoP